MRCRRDPLIRWTVRRVQAAALVVALLVLSSRGGAQETEAPRAPEGAVPHGPGGAAVRPAPPEEAPAAAPKVVMPKVTKYVEPTYPEAAKAAGLKPAVDLSLDIDREGKVKRAQVVAPIGNGFDEAAQAAALQLEFEPATRDGKPIPVRILWRYQFDFKEARRKGRSAQNGQPGWSGPAHAGRHAHGRRGRRRHGPGEGRAQGDHRRGR
jgi:TonB family protein